MEWQEKRKKWIGRNLSIELVADDVRQSLLPNTESLDTQLRREIQDKIKKLLNEGESTQNIIGTLIKNPEYRKYTKYFPSWVENHQRKKQIQKSNGNEERGE